jgi:hypothetical protein
VVKAFVFIREAREGFCGSLSKELLLNRYKALPENRGIRLFNLIAYYHPSVTTGGQQAISLW